MKPIAIISVTAREEDISGSNYDTAKNLWDAKWRMPTKKECEELYSNTTQTKSIVKGKNVLVVVGKNRNIMIVPESGHTSATGEDVHGVGFWTNTPLSSKYAYRQWEWEYVSFSEKEFGFPVRPVYCSNDPSSGIEDAIVDANSLSVRQYNGFITITNLKHGEVISVYSIAGSKILSSLASGNDMTLDLTSQAGRIVVVKIDHKTFKVRID